MISASIIGLGYVGLSTAVCLASKGVKTVGVDSNSAKLSQIASGRSPFYEPQVTTMLNKALKEHRFTLTDDTHEAVSQTELSFVTVGTPGASDGSVNFQQITNAAKSISHAIKQKKDDHHLVIIKSTVAPGTTRNIVKPILENSGNSFGLAVNPEFLRQGTAIHDTLNPHAIVIGSDDKGSGYALEKFYRRLDRDKSPPVIRTNTVTAELVKYANNAFLAMKVSFINTIANICEKTPQADVQTVAKAIGLDKRIGALFLKAGLGYGGSCFPKDLNALITSSAQQGYQPSLLEAVQQLNEIQPLKAVELAKKLIGTLKDKKIAVLGLSFKPDTDDMREAVSVKIIRKLLEEGASVVAHDPKAIENAKKLLRDQIVYAKTALDCISEADCCIVVTEWNEYTKLRPKDFIKRMKNPCIVDGRRIFNPQEFIGKVKFAAIGLGPQY